MSTVAYSSRSDDDDDDQDDHSPNLTLFACKRLSRNIRAYILFRHSLSAFHFKCIMCLMHSSGLVCSSNTKIYLKHHSPSFFHIPFIRETQCARLCMRKMLMLMLKNMLVYVILCARSLFLSLS